jgi:hypothetical protein
VTRTWKDNAHEFGALTKQGVDVRLAVLVACSVEQGVTTVTPQGKSSIKSFAPEAGTSMPRIKRHLDAWEKCASQGLCSPSADLTPDDANDPDLLVPTQEEFASAFDATGSGGRPRDSKAEDAAAIIEKRGAEAVVEASTPASQADLARALARHRYALALAALASRMARTPSDIESNFSHDLRDVEARMEVLMRDGADLDESTAAGAADLIADAIKSRQDMEREATRQQAEERDRYGNALGLVNAMHLAHGLLDRALVAVKDRVINWDDDRRSLYEEGVAKLRGDITRLEAVPADQPFTSDDIYAGLGMDQ